MVHRIGSTAQRLREKPYEKRVCRFESYPSCLLPEFPQTGCSVEQYVQYNRDVGLEVQVVAGDMDRGTPRFHSRLIPPHPDVDRDRLSRFIELAHENGIVVLSYYSMNYCKPLKKIHPEWQMQFLDDGRPPPENLGWFCFNSPYRDWLPEYLQEFVEHLDVDGFYFDDTNWGSHEIWPFWPSCCCPHCEALFRRETGLEIPRKVDFESVEFRKFLAWRCDKMRHFMIHLTRQVRARRHDVIMDFNYHPTVGGNWSVGHPINPLHLEEAGGYFFIERTFYCGSSLTSKVARAQGSPGAMWIGPTQFLTECINHTAPYAEPLTTMVNGLAAIQNGVRPVLACADGPPLLRHQMVKAAFEEFKKRVPFMGGDTVKYIALHWSQQSRDTHRTCPDQFKRSGEYFRQIRGTYEMLNQSQLLVDVVFDEHLTSEYLASYKVLFLSDSACLSEEQCQAIRKFVHGGGTLLATHETSLLDELGRKQQNFQLANVLGVDYGGLAGDGAVHGVVYVPKVPDLCPSTEHLICFAGREVLVTPRLGSDVQTLCTRCSLQGKRPLDQFDPHVNFDSGRPAVTCNCFGKGRAFYISGDVGGGYTHNPYPPLRRFVANLTRKTIPPLEVTAPKVIEMSASRQGPDCLTIHLLNNPTPYFAHSQSVENYNDIRTYFYNLEEINPIFNIEITLHAFEASCALLPLRNQILTVCRDRQSLVVPEVRVQEVVVLKGTWIH